MTAAQEREYHDLELESSNELLAHDSRRVLGRFEEAARHALQAGRARARMGQLRFAAGDYSGAAEDWLSAAACFLQASAGEPATAALNEVRRLGAEGRLAAARPDLAAALAEREQQLADLNWRAQVRRDGGPLQGDRAAGADDGQRNGQRGQR
jgi:hypothetical protein